MQLNTQTFAIHVLKGTLTLLVSTLVLGASSAQAQINGGFQSDVTGGVVSSFIYGPPKGVAFGRSLSFTKLSADLQNSLQTANSAAAALAQDSLGAFEASNRCVSGSFPESPERQQLMDSIQAVQSNIAGLNKETQAMLPGNDTVQLLNLIKAGEKARNLQKSLRFAIQATDALAKTSVSPEQKACTSSTYDAIGKAIAGLEKIAPALVTSMSAVNMG